MNPSLDMFSQDQVKVSSKAFGTFQNSLSLVTQATLILDHSGIIRYVDANVGKIFGYPAGQLVGRRFCRLLAEPYDTHYGVLLANIAAYHRSSVDAGLKSYVSPLPPGVSRIVEAQTSDGEMFSVSLSLSEYLENNRLSFIALIDCIPKPKGILTACKGSILSCNRACEDIFGYAEGELVGRRVADIIARAAPSDEATLSLDGLLSTRKGEISDDLTVYVDFVQGAHENISPLVAASVLGPARPADIVMHTMDGQRVPESPMREFDEHDLPALFNKNQNNNINVLNSNDDDDNDDNNNNTNNNNDTINMDDTNINNFNNGLSQLTTSNLSVHNSAEVFANNNGRATSMHSSSSGGTAPATKRKATIDMVEDSNRSFSSSDKTDLPLTFNQKPVQLSALFVKKQGQQFTAHVQVQRKRVGVVELFRGYIEPIDGGQMTVILVADGQGQILSCSQKYSLIMLGYTIQELKSMNVNALFTELPITNNAKKQQQTNNNNNNNNSNDNDVMNDDDKFEILKQSHDHSSDDNIHDNSNDNSNNSSDGLKQNSTDSTGSNNSRKRPPTQLFGAAAGDTTIHSPSSPHDSPLLSATGHITPTLNHSSPDINSPLHDTTSSDHDNDDDDDDGSQTPLNLIVEEEPVVPQSPAAPAPPRGSPHRFAHTVKMRAAMARREQQQKQSGRRRSESDESSNSEINSTGKNSSSHEHMEPMHSPLQNISMESFPSENVTPTDEEHQDILREEIEAVRDVDGQELSPSSNFALTLDRPTIVRHKSGVLMHIRMDIMRFKSNDGDIRFSLRLVADNAAQPSPELKSPTRSESSSPHNNKRTRDDVTAAQQSTPLNFDTSSQENNSNAAPAAKRANFIGDWMTSRILGRGSFATVVLGTHVDTGVQAAIKVFHSEKPDSVAKCREMAMNESNVLKLVRGHDNIVELLDLIDSDVGVAMVLQYARGGELFKEVVRQKGLCENDAKVRFKQLLSAVAHCHARGVAHRDLKHQNILTDDNGHIVLIDFSLAIAVDTVKGTEASMAAGTPAYAAPEMLRGICKDAIAADMWSLGIVLFSMVKADFPFKNIADVLQAQWSTERASGLSDSLIDLIGHMLRLNPKERTPAIELLSHPWLQFDEN